VKTREQELAEFDERARKCEKRDRLRRGVTLENEQQVSSSEAKPDFFGIIWSVMVGTIFFIVLFGGGIYFTLSEGVTIASLASIILGAVLVMGVLFGFAELLQSFYEQNLEVPGNEKRSGTTKSEVEIVRMERLTEQHKFYKEMFGIDLDLSRITIPKHKEGFDQLLIIHESMKPSIIIKKMQEKGSKVWTSLDLEGLDNCENERDPKNSTYTIWVRDRQEADEELKNKSVNDLKEEGIKGETLTERLIHGLFYWRKYKKHLDVKNITLCTGSRYGHGDVPRVSWHSYCGGVDVGWCSPSHARGPLRARVAVS